MEVRVLWHRGRGVACLSVPLPSLQTGRLTLLDEGQTPSVHLCKDDLLQRQMWR